MFGEGIPSNLRSHWEGSDNLAFILKVSRTVMENKQEGLKAPSHWGLFSLEPVSV